MLKDIHRRDQVNNISVTGEEPPNKHRNIGQSCVSYVDSTLSHVSTIRDAEITSMMRMSPFPTAAVLDEGDTENTRRKAIECLSHTNGSTITSGIIRKDQCISSTPYRSTSAARKARLARESVAFGNRGVGIYDSSMDGYYYYMGNTYNEMELSPAALKLWSVVKTSPIANDLASFIFSDVIKYEEDYTIVSEKLKKYYSEQKSLSFQKKQIRTAIYKSVATVSDADAYITPSVAGTQVWLQGAKTHLNDPKEHFSSTEMKKEVVFSGPEHLYREPRCATKLSALLRHAVRNSTSDQNDETRPLSNLSTKSKPIALSKRNLSFSSNAYLKYCAYNNCADAMTDILATSNGASGNFIDKGFFLGHKENLYPSGTRHDSQVQEPRDVRRLRELFNDVPLFDELADAPVPQWTVPSGCRSTHLVAAVEAILYASPNDQGIDDYGTSNSESLSKDQSDCNVRHIGPQRAVIYENFVFPRSSGETSVTKFFARYGFIGVLFYLNGTWEWFIVDDIIAMKDKDSSLPLFTQVISSHRMYILQGKFGPFATTRESNVEKSSRIRNNRSGNDDFVIDNDPLELWPYILHKAMAKAIGNAMDSIDGGVVRDVFETLTGCNANGYDLGNSSMEEYEQFEDRTAGNPTVCYMLNNKVISKGDYDEATGCVHLTNLARTPPSWIPVGLPMVVVGCYASTLDVTHMVKVRSPWGFLNSEGDACMDLLWSEFVELFQYYEVCNMRKLHVEGTHFVEAFDISRLPYQGTVYGDQTPNVLLLHGSKLGEYSGSPIRYTFRLDAPIKAAVMISLIQSDPKVEQNLSYTMRRSLPYGCLGLIVKEFDTEIIVFSSEQEGHVLDKRLSVELTLRPGFYEIKPLFYNCPTTFRGRVPYIVRVSSSVLTTLSIWRTGDDQELNSVTSHRTKAQFLQDTLVKMNETTLDSSVTNAIKYVDTHPKDQLITPNGREIPSDVYKNACEAFDNADILEKGYLEQKAAERAAFQYFLQYTREGVMLREKIASASSGPRNGSTKESQYANNTGVGKENFVNIVHDVFK